MRRRCLVSAVVVVVLLMGRMPVVGQSVASGSPLALTNADVARLVTLGISDVPIVAVIKDARQREFDLSAPALAALRAARVSEVVIGVMQQYVRSATSAPPVAALTPATLSTLSVSEPALSLIGLTQPQVRAKIGDPSLSQTNAWDYDSPAGTLHVSFTNGLVSVVRPSDFNLTRLPSASIAQPGLATPDTAAAPASSATRERHATARCKDGTYSYSTHRSGTCSGHGGVAQWL